jgi:N-acetylmuramic acid 6-phosphate etherase
MNEYELKAEKFLGISSQYKLGKLETELSHPYTRDLSTLARQNLPEAIAKLKKLDDNVIDILLQKCDDIIYLKDAIRDTFEKGNNVYFCGCGATGRLSLTIETLWRQQPACRNLQPGNVFSFMSGGDVALIRSIENFEDFPAYGARQLVQAGFKDGDLLVSTTEGGETPFVIGATEEAARLSGRKPFFLYCNPDEILCQVAERSEHVIKNPAIEKINLTVGPMAITGSTRMQSSTILLAVAGLALFYNDKSNDELRNDIKSFRDFWKDTDISFLTAFTTSESEFYKNGEYLLYQTDPELGITVITDTTERSPTFSLYPFENVVEHETNLSLCYLYLPGYKSGQEAWNSLLWREPRTLEWPDINGIASKKRLLGFDFSDAVLERRQSRKKQHLFRILNEENGIFFGLEDDSYFLQLPFEIQLFRHLALKMIMNTHSTIVMGRLGRYEGNVMTYLRASNNKLIDRSIRYIDMILREKNVTLSYSEICHNLFMMLDKTGGDQSIVLSTVNEILRVQKNNNKQ